MLAHGTKRLSPPKSAAFVKRNCETPPRCSVSAVSNSWATPMEALTKSILQSAMPALVRHIRGIRPHVVVTFGPEGGYGHPDHIAISQFTAAACMCAGDARYHTDHGSQSDMLPAHRIAKLYYLAWRNDKWDAYRLGAVQRIQRPARTGGYGRNCRCGGVCLRRAHGACSDP